jgi:hypothetical protein
MQFFSETRGLRSYTLSDLRKQVRGVFTYLLNNHYLAHSLGFGCIDGIHHSELGWWRFGAAGDDWASYFFARSRRMDLHPVEPVKNEWTEDQLFDFIQFLGQEVQKPKETWFHDFSNCGVHPLRFDREAGLADFLDIVNPLLKAYGPGWELKASLAIVELAPSGLGQLVEQLPPPGFGLEAGGEIATAIHKYRHRGATVHDRKDAVLALGRAFERYRVQAKQHLGPDESDLFNILNNFAIRHATDKQKGDYDPVWMAGLFYHYLAMIHVLGHLISREKRAAQDSAI